MATKQMESNRRKTTRSHAWKRPKQFWLQTKACAKKGVLIILIFLPLQIGIEKSGLPISFYIKKQKTGTYLASDIWLNVPKHERNRILTSYEQINWIDYERQ